MGGRHGGGEECLRSSEQEALGQAEWEGGKKGGRRRRGVLAQRGEAGAGADGTVRASAEWHKKGAECGEGRGNKQRRRHGAGKAYLDISGGHVT